MNCSTNINELAKALSLAQVKFASVKKDNPVDTGKYQYVYADLASFIEAVRKPLSEHGLAITQLVSPTAENGAVTVETVLLHESGQWLSTAVTLVIAGGGPQALGSAISYARRYGLSGILGIAAEEDDDGGKAQETHRLATPKRLEHPAMTAVNSKPHRPVAENGAAFQTLMAELIATEPGEGGRLHRLDLNGRVLAAKEAGDLTPHQLELLRDTYKAKEKGQ